MTDLEMTRLCAEAMGLRWIGRQEIRAFNPDQWSNWVRVPDKTEEFRFDPLHDDAQAMALVKKFRMGIDDGATSGDKCGASLHVGGVIYTAVADDLNRAIVEAVAKWQAAKVSK